MIHLTRTTRDGEPVLVSAGGRACTGPDLIAAIVTLERQWATARATPGRRAARVARGLELAAARRYVLLYLLDGHRGLAPPPGSHEYSN